MQSSMKNDHSSFGIELHILQYVLIWLQFVAYIRIQSTILFQVLCKSRKKVRFFQDRTKQWLHVSCIPRGYFETVYLNMDITLYLESTLLDSKHLDESTRLLRLEIMSKRRIETDQIEILTRGDDYENNIVLNGTCSTLEWEFPSLSKFIWNNNVLLTVVNLRSECRKRNSLPNLVGCCFYLCILLPFTSEQGDKRK